MKSSTTWFAIRTVWYTAVICGLIEMTISIVHSINNDPAMTGMKAFICSLLVILLFSGAVLDVVKNMLTALIARLAHSGILTLPEEKENEH